MADAPGRSPALPLGSASAPRWYDQDRGRFAVYLDALTQWGATAAELVLHHGPADDRIARVHVLEDDWGWVIDAYREAKFHLSLHASLHPRFALIRWADSHARDGLCDAYEPLLRLAATLARNQGRETCLVLHGAGGPDAATNAEATTAFLDWAAGKSWGMEPGVTLALELRRHRPARPDGSRAGIVAVVEAVGRPNVGVCWDVGHDWENRWDEPEWHPIPNDRFLSHVRHIHVHDAGPDGTVHYPMTGDAVPFRQALPGAVARGYRGAVTMEVRWRYAAALGEPWDLMERSYRACAPLVSLPVSTGGGMGGADREPRHPSSRDRSDHPQSPAPGHPMP